MSLEWYTIQVYSGSELSVKEAINIIASNEIQEQRIMNILVPVEELIEIKDGKKHITEKALYPGYVFIEVDLDTNLWHKLQALPKVSRFVGDKHSATPLSKNDINLIIKKTEEKLDPRPKISFINGENVRIIDGPFSNFVATVDNYDFLHGKLKLNISIFGRNTPVEMLYTQVEKII